MHVFNANIEKKRKQLSYLKASKETSTIPQMKKTFDVYQTERPDYLERVENSTIGEEIHYSLIDFMLCLCLSNKEILYKMNFTPIIEVQNKSIYSLKQYITNFAVILPTVKNIHLLPNLVNIDGTFHHQNKSVAVYLTASDQLNNVILLGFAFGQTENKQTIVMLLELFKHYMQYCENDPSIINFMSDRGEGILTSILDVFPENVNFNCSFHISKNYLSFIRSEFGKITITKKLSKTINHEFALLCMCSKEEKLIEQIRNICRIIYSEMDGNSDKFEEIFVIQNDTMNENNELKGEIIKQMKHKYISFNDIYKKTIEFIFIKTDPKNYISLFMKNSVFRFGKTTSQISEIFNHAVYDTKEYDVTQHVYRLVMKEMQDTDSRKTKIVNNTSILESKQIDVQKDFKILSKQKPTIEIIKEEKN